MVAKSNLDKDEIHETVDSKRLLAIWETEAEMKDGAALENVITAERKRAKIRLDLVNNGAPTNDIKFTRFPNE